MKMTLATVRGLAERSGFTLVKTAEGYQIVEDQTGRKLPNARGGADHKTAAEIYDSLIERL